MAQCLHHDLSYGRGHKVHQAEFIPYTEYVSLLFERLHVRHHLYADDMQAYIEVPVDDVDYARTVLHDYINHVRSWCTSRRLQLNAAKTELIWFGSGASLVAIRE